MDDPFFNYEAARIVFEEIPPFLRLAYGLRYAHHWSISEIAKELNTTKDEIRNRIHYTRTRLIRTQKRHKMILKHLEVLHQVAKKRAEIICKEAERQKRLIEEGVSLQECYNATPAGEACHG